MTWRFELNNYETEQSWLMRMGTFTDSLRVRVSMIIGNGISQLVKVLRSQKKINFKISC